LVAIRRAQNRQDGASAEPPYSTPNSSLEPENAAEAERLRHLTGSLRQALEKSGQYRIVDLAPIMPATGVRLISPKKTARNAPSWLGCKKSAT
jgi:hypothetical protein